MKRVTHLLFDANLTGGQIFALRLGEALRGLGWESDYVLPEEGPLVDLLERSGFDWHVVAMAGNPLKTALRLRQHLRANRPDVIHTHLVLPTQFAARLAAKTIGVPLVAHYHTAPTLPRGRVRRAVYRAIDRFGATYLSASNVAVSEALAVSLGTLGVHNIVVVPNGVVIPEEVRSQPETRTILVLGRVARAKGQDVAIKALAILPDNLKFRCRIVGDALTSDDRLFVGALRKLTDESGLGEQVDLRPATSEPAAELEEAWCLVLPSRSGEGMPLVILEAMALGVPVVAARLSGVPEVIEDGITGLLFEAEDDSGLAQALVRLSDNPELAAILAAKARARVEVGFSISQCALRLSAIYFSALPVMDSRSREPSLLYWQQNPVMGACEEYFTTLIQGIAIERPSWNLIAAVPPEIENEWRKRLPDGVKVVSSTSNVLRAWIQLQRVRPTLVHINDPAVAALVAARFSTVSRTIVTWHAPQHQTQFNYRAAAAMSWALRSRRLEVIALSSTNLRLARHRLRSGAQLACIEPGLIDHVPGGAENHRGHNAINDDPNTLKVVTVGRLSSEKRVDNFLRAVAEIDSSLRVGEGMRYHKAQGIVVGDGEERERLETMAITLGCGVSFLGWRDDVIQVLLSCDIFVLASDYEGLPFAMLEAMCVGLPVVATDVGGVRDVLAPSFGAVVERGSPHAIASAVLSLAAHGELAELGQMARLVFEDRFQAETMIRKTVALYERPPGSSFALSPSIGSQNLLTTATKLTCYQLGCCGSNMPNMTHRGKAHGSRPEKIGGGAESNAATSRAGHSEIF